MGLLEELAVRCEAADATKLLDLNTLNADILRALGWTSDGRDAYDPQGNRAMAVPDLVRSVDAAMLLVPDGWAWTLDGGDPSCDDSASLGPIPQRGQLMNPAVIVGAATPALALTAASLRARHALALSKGSDT